MRLSFLRWIIEYYHCGPSHLDYYVSWTDLVLQKIVICQVPTRHANYTDFKLVALFDRRLAYLYVGGFFSWRQLGSQWIIVKADTHLCDAIEHNGIIYAIDKADGTTYCWAARVSCFRLILMMMPWHCLNFLWWLAYPYLSRIWVELWQYIRDAVNQLYLEWVNSCDCDHVITANLYPWIIKQLGRYGYFPYFIVIYILLNMSVYQWSC